MTPRASSRAEPPALTSSNAEIPAWGEGLARFLDSALVIPGTRIKIGFDAVIGFFVPGAGDAVGALAALAIFYLGFKLRVPKVILLRMLVNVAVDAALGVIPVLGDAFDVVFRAADKNFALLRKHAGQTRTPPDFGDYAIVALSGITAVGLLLLPLAVGLALVDLAVRFSNNG